MTLKELLKRLRKDQTLVVMKFGNILAKVYSPDELRLRPLYDEQVRIIYVIYDEIFIELVD